MPREDKQRQQQGTAPYARPHACVYCASAFRFPSQLKMHVHAVHEKCRDHVCSYCHAAFAQAGNLKKHVRTVHEKRRDHVCSCCHAAFGKASDMRRHVRTQHHANNSHNEVAGRSPSPEVAAGILLSADYIVAALLNR